MSTKVFPLWLLEAKTLRAMQFDCEGEIASGISVALTADAKWAIEQIQSELDTREELAAEAGLG